MQLNKQQQAIIMIIVVVIAMALFAILVKQSIDSNKVVKMTSQRNQPVQNQMKENGEEVSSTLNEKEKQEPKIIASDIDTSDWQTYRNEEYGFELKYPDNSSYFVEETNKENITISQNHPGNRIHIKISDNTTFDSKTVKNINEKQFYEFHREGMGNGYGYYIEYKNKYYAFESTYGPINNIFESMMKTLIFD